MFKQCDILDDRKSKTLRKVSEEVTFPMEEKDILLMNEMIMYLRLSQDEKYATKNNIRAGMGLSAVQLGVLKRFFVISYKKEDGTFDEYKVINPKLISNSEELIYVEEGEGSSSLVPLGTLTAISIHPSSPSSVTTGKFSTFDAIAPTSSPRSVKKAARASRVVDLRVLALFSFIWISPFLYCT